MLPFDFDKACELYLEFGSDNSKKFLIKIFLERGLGKDYLGGFLRAEYAGLLQQRQDKTEGFSEKKEKKGDENPSFLKIDKEWRTNYAEAARYHERLKMLSEGEWDEQKAQELVGNILSRFKKIWHSWDIIDHYKHTGVLVLDNEPMDIDEAEALKRLQSIRTLLSPKRKAGLKQEKILELENERNKLLTFLQKKSL